MIIALQTLIYFRESLIKAVDRLLRPYYKHFSLAFNSGSVEDDDESEDHVFAEFDDEKGVVFYPPVYAQRYAAVSDCLMDEKWDGKLEKVVDLGYHDMSFIKYLKEVPGVRRILGVDIETVPLRCSSDLLGCEDYAPKREHPLQITLFHGNAADPDYRLVGCDAVTGIEMIEHMLPHDLDRLVHTVFGFIRPWVVVFTTPNGDFNELFKAMERNGLRRLDHFFEWTREQFNDWCSNIVVRYPEYTVSCKGIGPGPPGTLHLGCCSQMAVFTAKNYCKQDDLNINSLALVADSPSPGNISEYMGNWESPDNLTDPIICQSNGVMESFTEFPISVRQSLTTVLLSPSLSIPILEYTDKTSQCNLDTEVGKSFLMFDNELMFDVLVPRKRVNNRVYVIEDVSSRLNCTTLQVKKFSKTTQNLMAKNKIDSLVHTREVVDEIRYLTKALNFNKESGNQLEAGEHTWNNINWGDNAPYWNQYYKTVKEYNYPFETKSEESRILDLISEEISRLIDAQYADECSIDASRLEIPLRHLMAVVAHVTDDTEKVKDLLEWNGYEVVEDTVIHSRLVVDSSATHDDEWQDNDTFSDWDTADARSTITSDDSTFVPDYHGQCLRRALDQKVRKLRTMMSVDEDITTELDRVVCRLMKLALRSSRGRLTPPPARWMQCKLLDLLTLTEKAIERRKRHFIETYRLKAIEYDEVKPVDVAALERIKDDDTGTIIVDKYRHLLRASDKVGMIEDLPPENPEYDDFDFLSVNSKEFVKDFEYPFVVIPPVKVVVDPKEIEKDKTKLERVQAWVDEDFELVPYPEYGFDNVSSRETDRTYDLKRKHKTGRKRKIDTNADETRIEVYKISKSKTVYEKRKIKRGKNNKKASCTKISKKMTKKKSYSVLVKNPGRKAVPIEYEKYLVKPAMKAVEYPILHTTIPKPIPESLIELCHPQMNTEKNIQDAAISLQNDSGTVDHTKIQELNTYNIAATKESLLINIVMEEKEETIALRRTVGVDAEDATTVSDSETIIKSISNNSCAKHYVSTENVQSQTIFLSDINEPSTSKGIRHVSMDVQCGPDVTPVPSTTKSFIGLTNAPPIEENINDILANIKATTTDFGTYTQNHEETITPRMRSVGIKIRDSDVNLAKNEETSTITQASLETRKTVTIQEPHHAAVKNIHAPPIETETLKPIASNLNYSISDYYESVESFPKSSGTIAPSAKRTNNNLIELPKSKQASVIKKFWGTKYVRPTLSRGGIHVHSYRDKQTSEDVVFQGEWQRCGPKTLAQKKAYNPVVTRKMINTAVKRKRETFKEISAKPFEPKEHSTVLKKFVHKSNTKLNKKVVYVTKVENKRKPITSDDSVKLPFKNVVKVATKVTASTISSKNEILNATNKPTVATKNDNDTFQKAKKSYIPLYLKKNKSILVSNKNNLNRSIESVHTMIKVNKLSNKITPIVRSKTQEIKRDLLRFSHDPRQDLSYIVFRNDIENNTGEQSSPRKSNRNVSNDTEHQKGVKMKRIRSHQSPNSSTCSSPNSIVTVRAACARNRTNSSKRHSLTSNKSNALNSESDSSSPIKNKKPIKRCKNTKKVDIVDLENNKENIPDVPISNSVNDTPYIGRHNKVYIAQMKPESSHLQPIKDTRSLSKHRSKTQSNKSNYLIPTSVNTTEKATDSSSFVSKIKYEDLSFSSIDDNSYFKQEMSEYSLGEHSNMVLVLEPNQTRPLSCENGSINVLEKPFITEWIRNSSVDESNATLAVRQIVEEALDCIDNPFDNIDSETVILSRNDENESLTYSMSPQSFKTVVTNEDIVNDTIESDLELASNRTFDTSLGDESIVSMNDARLTPTDLDYLSLKSITSGSRYSEYFLADNEFDDTPFGQIEAINSNSVRDIFERRDLPVQNAVGSRAVQAFSGFSLITEPVAGDRADPVALIDSETGSPALETGRQATSEELFISGRSSDTYESCVIDEDAVVPHWLFNIISNQQSEVLDEAVGQLPVQMPIAEPLYDANGNLVDTVVGAGAGAGDGRGMHSDHSQDSSGRGTSLSSSEVSSEPQSDAILIDPSAFTNQYDLSVDSTANVQTDSTDTSYNNAEAEENTTGPSNSARIRLRSSLNASDIDADISSIDTDELPDSSTELN